MSFLDVIRQYGGGGDRTPVADQRTPPPFERNLGDMSWLDRYQTLNNQDTNFDPRSLIAQILMYRLQQQQPQQPQSGGNPNPRGYVPSLIQGGPPY